MKNVEEIFGNRQTNTTAPIKRTYDVRVTLNKSGGNSFVIRFGFINRAFMAFKDAEYIQPSDVEKCPYRIYFRTHNDKSFLDVYKVCKHHDTKQSRYFSITATEKAEKIYRAK